MQLTLTPGEIVGIAGLFLLVYRLIQSRLDKVQAENEAAHAGIVKRIDDVDRRAEERFNEVERRTEERFNAVEQHAEERSNAHRAVLDAIARDVAFLAGRQEERDRQAPPDTSL